MTICDEVPVLTSDGLDSPANSGLKLLAHGLFSLAAALGLRLDVFSHGPVSSMIGDHQHAALSFPCAPTPLNIDSLRVH